MNIQYFAHNGVDHATQADTATHSSSPGLSLVALTIGALAVVLVAAYLLSKSRNKTPTEQDEEE